MSRFADGWRDAWQDRQYKNQFLVSIAALPVALFLLVLLLNYIETRKGVVLNDPLLSLVSPIDFKWITFSLIYSGFLLGFVSLVLFPFSFLLALRAFIVMLILRTVGLYLLPLDPPIDGIPLIDPFVHMPGVRPVFTRDLFFSWHIALMALLSFIAQWMDMKVIFSSAAVALAVILLLQHSHYTIDVLAAPCFAYAALGIARVITVDEGVGLSGRS